MIRTIEEKEIDLSDYLAYNEARQSLARYLDGTCAHRRVRSATAARPSLRRNRPVAELCVPKQDRLSVQFPGGTASGE